MIWEQNTSVSVNLSVNVLIQIMNDVKLELYMVQFRLLIVKNRH